MAIRSLTYFDIPQPLRSEAAARTRANMKVLLSNPAMTQEQRSDLLAQIAKVSMWESGDLEVQGVTAPAKTKPPTNYGAP